MREIPRCSPNSPSVANYGIHGSIAAPRHIPKFAEYAYYGLILNAIFGFLSIPLLSAAMMAGLAAFCLLRLGSHVVTACAPIWLPIGCAVSFLMVQTIFHGESIMADYNRGFVTWSLSLLVVQCLSLREGFLHRYARASLAIGLLLLPYLDLNYEVTRDYQRAGLDSSVGLNNGNDLAAWFGFCCVYLIVVAVEAKRNFVRILSLSFAAGCFFVVGLTVSRGTLGGIAIASIIALRRVLRRGFLPVLLLGVLSSIIFVSGLFDQSIGSYAARKSEESGRFLTWPLAIGEFLNSPLVGIPVSQAGIYVVETGETITPHNGFLFIAVCSGAVPLLFFIAYWWKAGRGALRAFGDRTVDAPFILPLFLYAFVTMFLSNLTFMYPWVVVILSLTLAAGTSLRSRRLVELKIGKKEVRLGARMPQRTVRNG